MRLALSALIAAAVSAAALPALADTTHGKVLSFDAGKRTLVLTDRTVWILDPKLELPEALAPGDRVDIKFTSRGEEGVVKVNGLSRVRG